MSNDTRKQRELLAWAASKIQSAQAAGIFGTITIHLQGGTITLVETKQQDKPGQNPQQVGHLTD